MENIRYNICMVQLAPWHYTLVNMDFLALKKQKHNPSCDVDEETSSGIVNEELIVDSGDGMDLEIEEETANEE
jgi:hypothetical protein